MTQDQYVAAVTPHMQVVGRCWVWSGSAPGGRPQIRIGKRRLSVAKLGYETFRSRLPSHCIPGRICDTELCVNPSHIYAEERASAARRSWKSRRANGSWPCLARQESR